MGGFKGEVMLEVILEGILNELLKIPSDVNNVTLSSHFQSQSGDKRRLRKAVNAIIECVASGEAVGLEVALRAPAAGVQGVAPGHAGQYLMVLQVRSMETP